MSLLRISLFGRFDVEYGQVSLTGFDAGKVQELFCYLLLYREHPHPREALATLLWECSQTDRPNRCLRKTIWQLRSALNSRTVPLSKHVLLVEPDWIQLNSEADLWLDVAVFEEAFLRCQHLSGAELDTQNVRILEDALDLYRGGLQESWYQDWYLYERERFQHMYLIMLDKLMDHCEARGRFEAGLTYGTLILNCERARERTHRRLMRLYCLAGDRTAALRQYELCVNALDEELGVGPTQRTKALRRRIQMDKLSPLSLNQPERGEPLQIGGSTSMLLLRRLDQVHALLAEIRDAIHQNMGQGELAVDGQE
jgi:DNA-binding SARP family transcriptional activator